jgi:Ca2+-binding EF-hand superfamily protein
VYFETAICKMQTTTIKEVLSFQAGTRTRIDTNVSPIKRQGRDVDARYYDDDNFSSFDYGQPTSQIIGTGGSSYTSIRTGKSILIPPSYEDEEKKGNTLQIDRYFGPTARDNCGQRYQWLKNQTNILLDENDLLQRTRFDSSKVSALDFPFNPRRDDEEEVSEEEEEEDGQGDHRSLSTMDRSLVKYDVENGCPSSPRTKFLAGCIKNKLNPRLSLILRKRVTDELNLQHLGIGDEMGLIFAQSLQDLPIVRTINLADNNLTDQSLGMILEAITALPDLTFLDLSQNILDTITSKALADYLSSSECLLKKLKLSSADIDDHECHLFVQALKSNTVLEHLDLSRNKIGHAENLNTVQPDLITGGEAIASLLSNNICTLKYLSLEWNMLRLDGACALASSLAYNQYLTYLDLSYNGLGRDAGELLGSALLTNQTIERLLLMNNNLNFSACFTLCVAVEENHSLKRLQLDGNPIGEGGGRILMTIPSSVGGRVKVSANGCNILIKDQTSKFDITSPDGVYELTMSHPYERAIAYKLLRLIASHETYVFHRFAYLPDTFEPIMNTGPTTLIGTILRKGKPDNPFRNMKSTIPLNALEVKLEKVFSNEKAETLDEQQIELLRSLREVESAANNLEIAQRLFAEYDTDGSGSLDRVELHSLLSHVGLKMEMAVFDQAVDMFDIDGSGTLEVSLSIHSSHYFTDLHSSMSS